MNKKIIFIGFGAVAKCLSTLLIKLNDSHSIIKDYNSIIIIEPKDITQSEAYNLLKEKITCEWVQDEISEKNYKQFFKSYIGQNSLVIDLSYRVDTSDLLKECEKYNCLYINTAIDSWDLESPFAYRPLNKRFNETLVEIKDKILYENTGHKNTAILNHGYNPGMVSHIVKDFLKNITSKQGDFADKKLYDLCISGKYNLVAESLGITLIQITERDTQYSLTIKTTEDNFVSDWSIMGLIDEGLDRVQLTWGSHEKKACIGTDFTLLKKHNQAVLDFWGSTVRTMSYEPMKGKFTGTCIPHAESYSLAKLLRTNKYCPSIYYSYLMCNDAKLILNYAEFALDKDDLPKSYHVLRSDEIENGYDSVGCLFYFNNKNKGKKYYWYGSILDNEFAKTISPEVNATTIQVAISIYAAILWMQENPKKGILEPEELDTDFVLNIARPYLGDFYYKDVSNDYKPPGDTFYDLVVLPNSLFK